MPLAYEEVIKLEKKAHQLRHLIIDTITWAGSGHVGGALSAIDMLTILYYKYLNIDPSQPDWEERDRFVLSKGHIGVGFAPVLADKGFIDKESLKTYNHTGSDLGMHLNMLKVPGLDASTGSLGHGLPLALGMGLGARYLKKTYKVYCLLGDGECNEGSVWEAAMGIAHYQATNVITIVDRNQCMIDGRTEDIMKLEPFTHKWESFGFAVKSIDGHDFQQLAEAIEFAHQSEDKPTCIIANTFKGNGVKFMQDNYKYHYAGFDDQKVKECKKDLDEYHSQRLQGRSE
ncbi:MAG: transketolase [Spirochaetes bacterium]|nr:transketolase [Spirochaetota bacterium]